MLARFPSALRAVGLVVLTAWLAATLTGLQSASKVDITFALVIGLSLLGVGIVLESRSVRLRVPFLRPVSYDLHEAIRKGNALYDELRHKASDAPDREAFWQRIRDWDAESLLAVQRLDDREAAYVRNLSPYQPDANSWRQATFNFMDERLTRLDGLLKEQR